MMMARQAFSEIKRGNEYQEVAERGSGRLLRHIKISRMLLQEHFSDLFFQPAVIEINGIVII